MKKPLIRTAPLALAAALVLATALDAGPAAAEKGRAEIGKTAFGNYLAGRHAQAQKDLSSAADFLGAALKTAPEAPDLLRRTFILTLAEGRMAEAAVLARRLVKADPKMQVAQLTLAVEAIKRRRYADARKRLETIEGSGLGGFTAPVIEAWALLGDKKTDQALALLTKDRKEKATEALHAMHAALIYEVAGRDAEAEKQYVSVAEGQSGPSLRIVQLLGALYERTGQSDKARALYDRYRDEVPGSQLLDAALLRMEAGKRPPRVAFTAADGAAEALFGIASSLRQQNAREMGLVLGRLALYLRPKFPILQVLIGDLLESDGRHDAALAVYRAIDPKSPFSWSVRLRVAAILDELDRTDEAIKHLRRMARDRKDDPGPLIELGNVMRGRERFREAVVAYDDAIKRVPVLEKRHWSLLYARGIALERSKQWPRAEKDFEKALEFEPEQPYVLNYLGYSWIEQGVHLDKAKAMIEQAARLRPNDGYIVDSVGWGHYKLGQYPSAVEALERAVELRPQDPVINDHLGDAYWRVGRLREARFQWRRALSLDPEKDVIESIERKLEHGLGADTETAKKPGDDG